MADLLGLAKSALEGTLTMAKSAVEEERKLKKGVQRDLMLISDEFEMMRSFLNVTKDRVIDDMTRTYVRQVRDMALDVEDCIEVVHLDGRTIWWRRMLPTCMPAAAPATALDAAATEIELLKARVEAMGQRNMRYSQIGNSGTKPAEQTHQQAASNATAPYVVVETMGTKEKPRSRLELVELINNKAGVLHLQVISVLGTVGTMSIIKKAYDDPETCKTFGCRAWVKLMHPFSHHEFIRSLLTQFNKNYPPQEERTAGVVDPVLDVMKVTEQVLIKDFNKQITQKYLVVLEDLYTIVDWEAIRVYLPDKNNGSCIVVPTQNLEFASLCVGHPHRVSMLEKFSDDHSVYAFFNKDAGKDDGTAVLTKRKDQASQWLKEVQFVGREVESYKILSASQDLKNAEVFAVWGMAGVGKSALIKHVYNKLLESDSTFEEYEWKFVQWVNVSCHPFNIRNLSSSLLVDLPSEYLGNRSMFTIKDPIQECRDLLHKYKCLIVIDGLQSVQDWDLIKVAWEFESSSSSIIVITNEENVAKYCARPSYNKFAVKGLEGDDAYEIFKRKVSTSKEKGWNDLNAEATKQARLILHKCGGLPKVVVALAESLASRPAASVDWRWLGDNFMHELETHNDFASLQGFFAWVRSYFHTCPDFLKPCIFYLSIFPVNHGIRQGRLVRRWIAEGYARDTKESTAEEASVEFISKLRKLSIIQEKVFLFNGFFREYIRSRSMEDNLVFALEGCCSANSQRGGRHLTVGTSWDRDTNVLDCMDLSRLRSLTVFGEWRPFLISKKMRLLRVLDLEDTSGVTDGDVEQMVQLLPRLKFLSLRGCRAITRLPHSLGGLMQLQTLDVRHTSILRVPKSMTELEKLQYVRAGIGPLHSNGTVAPDDEDSSPDAGIGPFLALLAACLPSKYSRRRPDPEMVGVGMPSGMGKLTSLHTLGVVNISWTKAILEELQNLTQLHKLGVSGVNRDNYLKFFSAISGHVHLESLSVQLDKDMNQSGHSWSLDNIPHSQLKPLEKLQSLKLYGLIGKLPEWIKQLGHLRKLNLHMNMLQQEDINVLGRLRSLNVLRLCLTEFQDGQLQFLAGFSVVFTLEISCNSRLHAVKFDECMMTSLEVLKIRCCTSMSSLQLSGLEKLVFLKEVWVSGSYDDALKQHLQRQLDEIQSSQAPRLVVEERSLS